MIFAIILILFLLGAILFFAWKKKRKSKLYRIKQMLKHYSFPKMQVSKKELIKQITTYQNQKTNKGTK